MAKKTKTPSKQKTTSTSNSTKNGSKQPQLPIGPNTVLKLSIPAKEATQEYNKTLRSLASRYKAHGFRKGKAPLKIVEDQIGRSAIVDKTLDRVIPDLYVKLIKKENKKPLTRPEIKLESADKNQDWHLQIQIAEKPTIKLGNYQQVIKKGHSQAKKNIKDQQEHIKKHAEEHKKKPDLHKGHPAPKELTDKQKEEITLRSIFQELVSSINPEIPELLIKQDVRRQLDQLAQQVEQYKMTLEEYVQKRGITFEQLSSQMAIEALSAYQVEFILEEIKQDKKISSTDQEFDEYLKTIKTKKTRQELDPQVAAQITYALEKQKVISYLLNQ